MVLASTTASEAKLTAMRGKISGGYNFWLYEPEKTIEKSPADTIATGTSEASTVDKKPLIIFLHGQSLCGTNLDKVMNYGTLDAVISGRKVDAYVVGPQNPGGAWKPSKLADLIDWVAKNYPIDTNRVYLLGMSLGGFGTIDFVAAYPERVAAAMAFCGGGTAKDYSGLCSVPLWIIHGTADQAVSVGESRRVVNAMKRAGDTSLLRYDEWVGVNHSRLARLFYIKEVYDWLLSHSLTDSPRQVNKTINITNETLNNAYKGLNLASWNKKKSKK
jgi:predicted peptidase